MADKPSSLKVREILLQLSIVTHYFLLFSLSYDILCVHICSRKNGDTCKRIIRKGFLQETSMYKSFKNRTITKG